MKEKINPKSYVFIKYLFTIAMVLMYLVGMIALATAIMRSNGQTNKWIINNFLKLAIIFISFSMIFASIYLILRIYIHKKTDYKYKPSEIKKIYLNFGLFATAVLISIYLMLASRLPIKVFFISSIIFNIILITLGFIISILDELTSANEKSIVIKTWMIEKTTPKAPQVDPSEVSGKKEGDKKNPFMEE